MIKRVFDVVFATVIAMIFAPVLVVVAMLVWILLGRPILFAQTRPGLNGQPFRMYKFRSMLNQYGRFGELLPDEQRLTGFGRFLRATSLDELPELWNVIKGDMSLVGPRPLLMEYLPLYNNRQFRRHEVRPGITGWAQVNGRNSVDWEERFELDVWYVENQSFWLDIRILITTLFQVVKRQGISHEGNATMPNYRGGKKGE